MRSCVRIFLIALVSCLASPALAASGNTDSFDPEVVKSGATMTKEKCNSLEESVWVVVDKTGDCIRYYAAGLKPDNDKIVVFFSGDRLVRKWDRHFNTISQQVEGYQDNNADALKLEMQEVFSLSGIPTIFLARPGIYGSSGDHRKRRLLREVELVNGALNAIRDKHHIRHLSLAGQSGGGHLVASMLAMRSDITCASIASGATAVRARIQLKNWPGDATGYNNFYDPIDHVSKISPASGLRIFVIGDPRDTNVPFSTQSLYYDALKKRGLDAHLLKATGRGSQHHSLGRWAFRVAGWCANGLPTEAIVSRVKMD